MNWVIMRLLRTCWIYVDCRILVPSFAQAHSASTFNVIIKQNDLQPMTTQIEYNDSIMWYNADSRENVTQRIVYDSYGDGL